MEQNDISWSRDYLLTWDDFQGIPKETNETIVKSIKSISRTGLDFEIYNKIIPNTDRKRNKFQIEKIIIKAVFNKKQSWVKLNEIKLGWKNILLKHEQGHFDISQMCVFEAKKRLDDFVKNRTFTVKGKTTEELEKNADNESIKIINGVIEQIKNDLKNTQDKYDEDTKHGTILEIQKEYDQKFERLRVS